jgi:hypothetical protein
MEKVNCFLVNWNMSFGSGNSNGFALQNSNVSRIFHIVNIDEISPILAVAAL